MTSAECIVWGEGLAIGPVKQDHKIQQKNLVFAHLKSFVKLVENMDLLIPVLSRWAEKFTGQQKTELCTHETY